MKRVVTVMVDDDKERWPFVIKGKDAFGKPVRESVFLTAAEIADNVAIGLMAPEAVPATAMTAVIAEMRDSIQELRALTSNL